MNVIIAFNSLDIDFLRNFLQKFEQNIMSNFSLIKNYTNNQDYAIKYYCNFFDNKEFLRKQKDGELICAEESYFINMKQGINLYEIEEKLQKNQIIILNTSRECKFLLRKRIKNANFISILIEKDMTNYQNEFLDFKKKSLIIKNNKSNHEYNSIIVYRESIDDEGSFYSKVINTINNSIQENIILENSKNNIK